MAKTSNSTSTTVYRLHKRTDLQQAIKDKYLDSASLSRASLPIAGTEALFISGMIQSSERVSWSSRVGALVDIPIELSNQNSAAVLLIPSSNPSLDNAWALCWGMGWLLLNPARIDAAFGLRTAIRALDSTKLQSLTRNLLDERSRIDRSSIPAGADLFGFGIGGFGELVTKITGKAEIEGLTCGKKFTVKGSDSLTLPLGNSLDDLLSDLSVLEDLLSQDPPQELRVLEHLSFVKKNSSLFEALEQDLLTELHKKPGDSNISVAWPHERGYETQPTESFKVKNAKIRGAQPELPTVELILKLMEDRNSSSLANIKIQLFSDPEGKHPASREYPLRNWIAFETVKDEKRFFLHEGNWIEMDQDYATRLDEKVTQILAQPANITMPNWNQSEDEGSYNKRAAEELDAISLDRKLISTRQNVRGFEACDIYTPDNVFIHVKKARNSASLSHLFAQGANSVHCLMHDEEARTEFNQVLADAKNQLERTSQWQNPNPSQLSKPKQIVFAIRQNKGKKLTPEDIFSFSKVTLVRVVNELESRGVDVRIAPIDSEESDAIDS